METSPVRPQIRHRDSCSKIKKRKLRRLYLTRLLRGCQYLCKPYNLWRLLLLQGLQAVLQTGGLPSHPRQPPQIPTSCQHLPLLSRLRPSWAALRQPRQVFTKTISSMRTTTTGTMIWGIGHKILFRKGFSRVSKIMHRMVISKTEVAFMTVQGLLPPQTPTSRLRYSPIPKVPLQL